VLRDDLLDEPEDLGSGSFRSEPLDKADELESGRAGSSDVPVPPDVPVPVATSPTTHRIGTLPAT